MSILDFLLTSKPKTKTERKIFAKGVIRVVQGYGPDDFDQDALYKAVLAVSGIKPWPDSFGKREEINIDIKMHIADESKRRIAAIRPAFDPDFMVVTLSHGCYKCYAAEELPAYKDYIQFVANELTSRYPHLRVSGVFLETVENLRIESLDSVYL